MSCYVVNHCCKTGVSLYLINSQLSFKRYIFITPKNMQQTVAQFVELSKKWFYGVESATPIFLANGKDIQVLTHPEEFYKELLLQSSIANKRISLASLYLGNGEKEEKLIQVICDNLKKKEKPFEVNILLEYTRGSRGAKSSRTVLLPLKKHFGSTSTVALFHTPNLRGILKAIIPPRFDETVNVSHVKAYVFDDTLILSGANLSVDYFTNRQDRYIIFRNNKILCDYFQDLIKTISSFSFALQSSGDVTFALPHIHPYKGSKNGFNKFANKQLCEFTERYKSQYSITDAIKLITQLNTLNSTYDTLIFPLLQMKNMGITTDEKFTTNVLSTAPNNSNLTLATAYFNLTDNYWNMLLNNHAQGVKLIMAHPKAMGFYKAPGLAGGVPNAYSLISKWRYRELIRYNQYERIQFLEFYREKWTFHGKGLWFYLQDSLYQNKNKNTFYSNDYADICSPLLTLIGSPNFGKRSVYRDMEAQVGIVTVNKKLQFDLIQERNNMLKDTTVVNLETFDEEERKISWWVYLITKCMNDQF
nr:unnamed protein product [Hydra vulgaris]